MVWQKNPQTSAVLALRASNDILVGSGLFSSSGEAARFEGSRAL